jgi:hypothetical protein
MDIHVHPIETVSLNKILDLPFNRNKKEDHVKKLTKSIAKVGILRTPVLVKTRAITGKLEIYNVDGQHLVESLKRVNIAKISAFVVETDSLNEIVEMMAVLNNVQQKWTILDYVNAYCGLGSQDYFQLKDHALKNHLSLNVSAAILSGNSSAMWGQGLNGIRNGSFKVSAQDAEVLTQNLIEVASLVKVDSTKFDCAYINFYRSNSKKYNHSKMIAKIKENAHMFENIPHDTGFILNLFNTVYKG